jgi:hypothetical protein
MCEAGCTVWDMSDIPVPGTVSFGPKPRIFGNRLVGVSSVRAPLMCLGLPCKVINQSIVGLSLLSEIA